MTESRCTPPVVSALNASYFDSPETVVPFRFTECGHTSHAETFGLARRVVDCVKYEYQPELSSTRQSVPSSALL